LLGLALLTLGGETVVRSALAVARRLGLSPLLAGLVIVGLGTSAPELVVSIKAALNAQPEIALGNAIGSNIANILLILGISALILPLHSHLRCLKRDGVSLLVATVVFMGLASFNGLSRLDGLMMLLLLAAYLIWAYRTEKADTHTHAAEMHHHNAEVITKEPMPLAKALLVLCVGFALLIYGADRFLFGAVGLAQAFGVPDAIIGLTVVAVGTSLPELAASIVAAMRREADLAVGNVLGSNIFNTLLILGSASVVSPLPFGGRLLHIDQWVMLGATVMLLLFLYFGLRITRIKGAILLLSYITYVSVMFGLQV
jgi:cation:H+ antiporter